MARSLPATLNADVTFAIHGKNALEELAQKEFKLMFLDLTMPEMDGLQLLKALRQNKQTRRIGFILVTGSGDAKLISKAREYGVNNYLKKPFTPQGLQACIEQVVGKL